MAKENLGKAKKIKNDEFYTQYQDIEKEMNAYLEYNPNVFRGKTILLPCDDPEWSNFTRYFAQKFHELGIKKVISTSFAADSKSINFSYQPTLFEMESPIFDARKTRSKGKIFTLSKDITKDGVINFDDIEWNYLEGDGDFRSDEIKTLRDEADIIITNPPFSLFREFLTWLTESNKSFSVIGNMNAITYKDSFSLIKTNKMWLGATNFNVGMYFRVPDDFVHASTYKFDWERSGVKVNRVPGVCWYTNIDHGRRHEAVQLMTQSDNIKYNKHVSPNGYPKYDNYDAIEISFADSIPSDYDGVMGVPISFLSKYNPDQFEILGLGASAGYDSEIVGIPFLGTKDARPLVNKKNTYARIFLRHRKKDR